MFYHSARQRARATLQRLCFAMLLAFCLPATPSIARADSMITQPAITRHASEPCLGWTWSKLFSPAERLLGNQTRMIQFGVFALISAMYIIWWRK